MCSRPLLGEELSFVCVAMFTTAGEMSKSSECAACRDDVKFDLLFMFWRTSCSNRQEFSQSCMIRFGVHCNTPTHEGMWRVIYRDICEKTSMTPLLADDLLREVDISKRCTFSTIEAGFDDFICRNHCLGCRIFKPETNFQFLHGLRRTVIKCISIFI